METEKAAERKVRLANEHGVREKVPAPYEGCVACEWLSEEDFLNHFRVFHGDGERE